MLWPSFKVTISLIWSARSNYKRTRLLYALCTWYLLFTFQFLYVSIVWCWAAVQLQTEISRQPHVVFSSQFLLYGHIPHPALIGLQWFGWSRGAAGAHLLASIKGVLSALIIWGYMAANDSCWALHLWSVCPPWTLQASFWIFDFYIHLGTPFYGLYDLLYVVLSFPYNSYILCFCFPNQIRLKLRR